MFAAVDKVIEVGQDPRRFAEDLLRRLRDLIIVAAVPEALSSGLVDVAGDQGERLTAQATALGPGELTRAAEVIAVGLTEMRGTTAPRLHLELMCARVLLPGADVNGRGLHARLDRLERRLSMGTTPSIPDDGAASRLAPDAPSPIAHAPAAAVSAAAAPDVAHPGDTGRAPRKATEPKPPAPPPVGAPPAPPAPARPAAPARAAAEPAGHPEPLPPDPAPAEPADHPEPPTPDPADHPEPPTPDPAAAEPAGQPEQHAPDPAPAEQPTPDRPDSAPASGGIGTADLRRLWPQVLDNVKDRRRFTWILLSQNAQVVEVREGVLTLGLTNVGARDSFGRGGSPDVLREAILEVIGEALHINPIVDVTADASAGQAPSARTDEPETRPASPASPPRSPAAEEARANLRPTRSQAGAGEPGPEAEPSRDDQVMTEDAASAEELMVKHLGAELIADDGS